MTSPWLRKNSDYRTVRRYWTGIQYKLDDGKGKWRSVDQLNVERRPSIVVLHSTHANVKDSGGQ